MSAYRSAGQQVNGSRSPRSPGLLCPRPPAGDPQPLSTTGRGLPPSGFSAAPRSEAAHELINYVRPPTPLGSLGSKKQKLIHFEETKSINSPSRAEGGGAARGPGKGAFARRRGPDTPRPAPSHPPGGLRPRPGRARTLTPAHPPWVPAAPHLPGSTVLPPRAAGAEPSALALPRSPQGRRAPAFPP